MSQWIFTESQRLTDQNLEWQSSRLIRHVKADKVLHGGKVELYRSNF